MAESATVNTVTNKKRAADGEERYSTSVIIQDKGINHNKRKGAPPVLGNKRSNGSHAIANKNNLPEAQQKAANW